MNLEKQAAWWQTLKPLAKTLFRSARTIGANSPFAEVSRKAEDIMRGPATKRFFGLGKEVKPSGLRNIVNEAPKPQGALGHIGNAVKDTLTEPLANIDKIKTKGLGHFIDDQIWKARHFEKVDQATGKTYYYKRSALGQIANVGFTGPGVAAQEVFMGDPKEPTYKRIGRAATQGALWSLSPRLGGIYYGARLLGDVGKQF